MYKQIIAVLTCACVLLSGSLVLPAHAAPEPEVETASETESQDQAQKKYIRWVDFTPSASVLRAALEADISTYKQEHHVDWVTLLSVLAAKNGGNFSAVRVKDVKKTADALASGTPAEELIQNQKLYRYYLEAFDAVLGGMVGEYKEVVRGDDCTEGEVKYGLRVFSPIAAGYSYSDYDDFGSSRSYGYRRRHLGHDILGSIGTPIIAVESGYVEHLGWNQYGGWRIGIRSLDGKRYYYYAHLRKDHPYAKDLCEGNYVNAGEVIGYLGMTGYSAKENVNNINVPHLHFGMELIFDASQIEGWNQIWIDLYQMTAFLAQNRSHVTKNPELKESVADVVYRYTEMPED